jgi:putative addiction module component (TIGR02574 family)
MSTTPEELSQAVLRLAPAERLALVEHILDSLDVPDPTLDDLWAREAQDRLSAYRRGEIQAIPLSDVLVKYQTTPRG